MPTLLPPDVVVLEGHKMPYKKKLIRKWTSSSKTHKATAKRTTVARKKKKPTRTKLIKEADRLASLYVRQSHADKNGMVKCYTCDHVAHIKKIQNGHWVVRQYKYVRWHEDNMRPQCYACNFLFNGRPHIFRENLVKEIGEARVRAVEDAAKSLFQEKDDWIENIIASFAAKLTLL